MAIVKKLLITAGPTREHLDPVRFITNLPREGWGIPAESRPRKGIK